MGAGGGIICVVFYNARCCAVAARCHILVIPAEKARRALKKLLAEIYLPRRDEDYAQDAILHFIQRPIKWMKRRKKSQK